MHKVYEPSIWARLGTAAHFCLSTLDGSIHPLLTCLNTDPLNPKVTSARFCVERDFFIDFPPVRIHCIILMIWWTGLTPWEFEFPFSGSLTSTFLGFCVHELSLAFEPSCVERTWMRLSSYTSTLGDIWLWVGVPWPSSALVVPLLESSKANADILVVFTYITLFLLLRPNTNATQHRLSVPTKTLDASLVFTSGAHLTRNLVYLKTFYHTNFWLSLVKIVMCINVVFQVFQLKTKSV